MPAGWEWAWTTFSCINILVSQIYRYNFLVDHFSQSTRIKIWNKILPKRSECPEWNFVWSFVFCWCSSRGSGMYSIHTVEAFLYHKLVVIANALNLRIFNILLVQWFEVSLEHQIRYISFCMIVWCEDCLSVLILASSRTIPETAVFRFLLE